MTKIEQRAKMLIDEVRGIVEAVDLDILSIDNAHQALTSLDRWIEVKDGLPEKDGEYFVELKYSVAETRGRCYEADVFKDGKWEFFPDYVIRWQDIIPSKRGKK